MTRRRSIARRLIWRAALAAILGSLTVLAFCWIVPQFTGMVSFIDTESAQLRAGMLMGSDRFWLREESLAWESLSIRRIAVIENIGTAPRFGNDQPPAWSRRLAAEVRDDPAEVTAIGTGWPWRAMSWERMQPARVEAHPDGGVTVSLGGSWSEEDRHSLRFELNRRLWILPTRPLWRGLIADFALAWLAWAILLAGPLLIRVTARRLRDRCVHCGYSLRGAESSDACPECGAPIPRRWREVPTP